jgi:hypothetical protein
MGLETATVVAIASVVSSAASAAYGAYASNQAAKQEEMNAQAQADALRMEQTRKNQELAENMKRQAVANKRFRATQAAEMSGMNINPTVGTPLDFSIDTVIAQNRELQSMVYDGELTQRELAYGAQSALAMGDQKASNYRMQAGATILSGASSALGAAYNRPKTSTTGASSLSR